MAQLASFATFAAGFVACPVGRGVLRLFGDVCGRKWMLVTALIVMGLATAAIGVLPTYAQAGAPAQVILMARPCW